MTRLSLKFQNSMHYKMAANISSQKCATATLENRYFFGKKLQFFRRHLLSFYTSHSEAKTDDQLFSADIPKDPLPPATSALALPVHSSPLRSLLVHPLRRAYINDVGVIKGVQQDLKECGPQRYKVFNQIQKHLRYKDFGQKPSI